jgi:aldose sugar dehydrogenase
MNLIILLLFALYLSFVVTIVLSPIMIEYSNATISSEDDEGPFINDPGFKAELIYKGIRYGTNMAVLSPDDILVLERFEGTVQRIINGNKLEEPILDVNVSSQDGMLGIAVPNGDVSSPSTLSSSNEYNSSKDVYLYYTEAQDEDGGEGIGNRLYKYQLVDNKLINPNLLLDLPASPGRMHHGGEILIGPDNNIYLVIGEVGATGKIDSKAINIKNGLDPDGRAGILRVTQDGQPVGKGILGDEHPLDMYYAYGIRNSFGMDFDPVTGKLWDTENGPEYGDEINLVEPGFNSGWKEIQGMMKGPQDISLLEDFGVKGKYSDPELTWEKNIGPTALKFLDSDKYGVQYKNDMFLGDVNDGRIYHFDLNKNRTQLLLDGEVEDKVATNPDEIPKKMVFGQGFGTITDIELGPDGYMYVLTHDKSDGAVYRIVPAFNNNSNNNNNNNNGVSQELEESEDIDTNGDGTNTDDKLLKTNDNDKVQ